MTTADTTNATFTIPVKLPQANKFRHLHWAAKKKVVDKWRKWTWTFVRANEIGNFECPVKIKVVQICGKGDRCYDRTNLLHVADKLIIDGLVKMEIIVNDTPKWLDVSTDYEKGTESGVRIEITSSPRPAGKSAQSQGHDRGEGKTVTAARHNQ